MQPLSPAYLVAIARQIAFLGAFLGGFAATFLATLVSAGSPKRAAGWTIGAAAVSACAFVVAVMASVTIGVVFHPDAPANVRAGVSVTAARIVSMAGFGVGVYALLLSVGVSGWIRSRRSGVVTSLAAGVGVVLVTWAMLGFA